MKYLTICVLPVLAALLFCTACGDNCDDPSAAFQLLEDRAVAVDSTQGFLTYSLIAGDHWVAKYNFVGAQCDDIADDEFSEELVLEFDPTLDSFAYTDAAIAENGGIYRRSCFCGGTEPMLIEQGIIEGSRIGNARWAISGTIRLSDGFGEEVEVIIDGVFTR